MRNRLVWNISSCFDYIEVGGIGESSANALDGLFYEA